ncbi:hypothetical protein DNJ72_08335 [Prochlorococcus marinus XMU1403]|uniref:hypothetical protein n=1 Tax=Prochlorococcus marinus TaxID=1219 RepID=UPI000D92E22D|nr:hypothetical protein [Prochlorococcus marinus]MBW3050149.1 hypothetical protein [Prochlorococcus marinus str. MU1403]PYE00343.1 hypothetical protein DNJ72_08335 [Prochlorococcus marinus XMU1403]
MSLPPHFLDEKKKEVAFYLTGTFPVQLAIPPWMQSFPECFKGVTCRCEETIYKKEGGKILVSPFKFSTCVSK